MLPPKPTGTVTQGIFVYRLDVGAHCAGAQAAVATISEPLADHGYGLTYTARRRRAALHFTRLD